MFWGNLTLRFLYPEISRWRTYTGSSYNFATENDMRMISAAATMFRATSTDIVIARLRTTASGANRK